MVVSPLVIVARRSTFVTVSLVQVIHQCFFVFILDDELHEGWTYSIASVMVSTSTSLFSKRFALITSLVSEYQGVLILEVHVNATLVFRILEKP